MTCALANVTYKAGCTLAILLGCLGVVLEIGLVTDLLRYPYLTVLSFGVVSNLVLFTAMHLRKRVRVTESTADARQHRASGLIISHTYAKAFEAIRRAQASAGR